ncbi:MAG: DUF3090 family protein [Actinomycetota bacterium]|nr:DUF3090 family protein [Actinomycetota bacterium]
MSELEVTPEIFTADYVGSPGERAFYVQVRGSFGTHSYEIEKQQVRALADKLRELLVTVDSGDTVLEAEAARDPALALESPVEPDWRVGTIGLAYDEDTDTIMVLLQPPDVEDPSLDEPATPLEQEPVGSEETELHRLHLRRDQVRAFVLHATSIVSEGRPTCQLCGLPMDPGGHVCPANNGHRKPT